MEEITIYVPWTRLKKVNSNFLAVLEDLQTSGVIKSFSIVSVDTVGIVFTKAKAAHIQTVLEFYDSRTTPDGPIKPSRYNED